MSWFVDMLKFLAYLVKYPFLVLSDVIEGMFKLSDAVSRVDTLKDVAVSFGILAVVMFFLKVMWLARIFALLSLSGGIFYIYWKGDWRNVELRSKWKKVNPEEITKKS